MNTLEEIQVQEIRQQFVDFTLARDIEKLGALLHDQGKFMISSDGPRPLRVKNSFLKFYKQKMAEEKEITVEYDQCMHCNFGCTVILFNDGIFPVKPTNHFSKWRSGINLEIKDGLIYKLTYCHVLLHHDNPTYIDEEMVSFIPDPDAPF